MSKPLYHPLEVPVLPIKEPRLGPDPVRLRIVRPARGLDPDTSPAEPSGFAVRVEPERHFIDTLIDLAVGIERGCRRFADSMLGRYLLDLRRSRQSRKRSR